MTSRQTGTTRQVRTHRLAALRAISPRVMLSRVALVVALAASVTSATPARAQLAQAITEAQTGNYGIAARMFFDVSEADPDPYNRQSGLYYLGESLMRLNLYVPSLYYLSQVVEQGPANKHFLQAVELLVQLQSRLDDDYIVPQLLDASYSAEFSQIKPEILHHINYLVGKFNYTRREYQRAVEFLDAVGSESLAYPEAQYLVGVTHFARREYEPALERLNRVVDATTDDKLRTLPVKTVDDSLQLAQLVRVRRLAQMGLARTLYGLGRYPEAVEQYGRIPRFTDEWLASMFENGWTHFQNASWGKALGNVHTLLAPHFNDYYVPEAWLLRATAYYNICKFDLSEVAVKKFYEHYEPVMKTMETYLGRLPKKPSPDQFAQLYAAVSGEPEAEACFGKTGTTPECSVPVPRRLHIHLKRLPRFRKLDTTVQEIRAEREIAQRETSFANSRLQTELVGILTQQEDAMVKLAGQWAFSQATFELESLQQFYNQAQIIQFEVAKAQKDKLMAGPVKADLEAVNFDVEVPRPVVPDGFQYYAFDGEFWLDELGYYELSVLDECKGEDR